MPTNPANEINFQYLPRLLICLALLSGVCAYAANSDKLEMRNDEETFVFTGVCSNGEPYRLLSYQKHVGDLPLSYYDFDGPAGKGTVQSNTYPKVMAVRVCRKLAEIINANYWE